MKELNENEWETERGGGEGEKEENVEEGNASSNSKSNLEKSVFKCSIWNRWHVVGRGGL